MDNIEGKWVNVSIPKTTYADYEITFAEFYVIKELWERDLKVVAIKFLRKSQDIGLYEAKQICEKLVTMKSAAE